MGKIKIGKLYDKVIIDGDINLKKDHEIHKTELGSSSNEGGEGYL